MTITASAIRYAFPPITSIFIASINPRMIHEEIDPAMYGNSTCLRHPGLNMLSMTMGRSSNIKSAPLMPMNVRKFRLKSEYYSTFCSDLPLCCFALLPVLPALLENFFATFDGIGVFLERSFSCSRFRWWERSDFHD